ncbi:PRELI domain-containing protein 1, mitochondrial [Aphelenchoides bicaudatus]|nr:PRELI domain-containing protein 1, mitochondrial [Aphelenchoides bicaudatus]
MKFCTGAAYFFNYSFKNTATTFYDKYPNSYSKNILSEDVISLEVQRDKIITKKLIIKEAAHTLKDMPSWISKKLPQIAPTVEESVFDRNKNTLVTYTRNVSWRNVAKMDEKCIFTPEGADKTKLERSVAVDVNYGRLSGLIEKVLMVRFRGAVTRIMAGLNERLNEKFCSPDQGLTPSL